MSLLQQLCAIVLLCSGPVEAVAAADAANAADATAATAAMQYKTKEIAMANNKSGLVLPTAVFQMVVAPRVREQAWRERERERERDREREKQHAVALSFAIGQLCL